jgi:hypothetical protein
MSSGDSRRPLVAAGAVAVALLVVGCVDFAITSDRVPEPPRQCLPSDEACTPPPNSAFTDRLDRIFELEDGLETRAWLYASAAFLAMLASLAIATRGATRSRERYTDIGVFGVAWLVVALVIALIGSEATLAVPTAPLFGLGVALVVVAGLGTLATPPARMRAAHPSPPFWSSIPVVIWFGLGLSMLAIIVAAVASTGRGDPCFDPEPGWFDAALGVAAAAAFGAAVCGIVALTQRRWIAAILLIAAAPFVVLLAAFASACWN